MAKYRSSNYCDKNNPSYVLKAIINSDAQFNEDPKYLKVKEAIASPESNKDIMEAIEIFQDPNKRLIMNSFILANCEDDELSETLKIEKDIISAYKTYCFNMGVFKTELDKFAFINSCPAQEKEAYQYSIKFGRDFIKWKICGLPMKIDNIRDQLAELFTLSKFKANVAVMSNITKDSSKEAFKWLGHSIRIAEVISRNDLAEKGPVSLPGEENSLEAGSDILGVLVKLRNTNSVKPASDVPGENIS